MSHQEPVNLDIDKIIHGEPLTIETAYKNILRAFMFFGIGMFCFGLLVYPHDMLWGAYYTNLVFWMGIAVGGVAISVIFRIVKAKWAPPVRRIAEANISFLPWAFLLFLATYYGREELFFWGDKPMPGREWWMQPDFVYGRFTILLGILFFVLWKFVRFSLRVDVGLAKEKAGDDSRWAGIDYRRLIKNWKGSEFEIKKVEKRLTTLAPIAIILYALIYSMFAFEMMMGMDNIFFSNMFGGFVFIGNILGGWAMLSLLVIYIRKRNKDYEGMARNQQFHDLGKLTFGFCILWAYLFFAQFLPIWYGNLPEETQWLILRTREEPWRTLGWAAFSMCFITPFILLLSRDVKKTPLTFALTCCIILGGLWIERYVVIMPQLSPAQIPFSVLEISFFVGFLGTYGLCMEGFLKKYPIVPISDPLAVQGHGH